MDFAAIAHDLRSPLNVMLGHMQMLAAEGISEVSRRRLEILDRQIHRMIRLLDSCGKQPYQLPSFSAVDLNTTIRKRSRVRGLSAREEFNCAPGGDTPLLSLWVPPDRSLVCGDLPATRRLDTEADGSRLVPSLRSSRTCL